MQKITPSGMAHGTVVETLRNSLVLSSLDPYQVEPQDAES